MSFLFDCEWTHREIDGVKKSLRLIEVGMLEIIHLLNRQTGFNIAQVQGEKRMPITGIVAGSQGVFQETPLPIGASIPAGTIPVWTASDPSIALTPSADGSQVTAGVPSGFTGTSFSLTVQNQDGTFPTTVSVPVTQPVVAQTGFQIDQVS